MELLAYSGIGGERSSGYGRFETEWVSLEANDDGSPAAYAAGAEELLRRLRMADAEKYMSLSVCLPAEEELDDVISGADYLTVRRGGWVSSATYADAPRKKRDIYMLAAGAVFGRDGKGEGRPSGAAATRAALAETARPKKAGRHGHSLCRRQARGKLQGLSWSRKAGNQAEAKPPRHGRSGP